VDRHLSSTCDLGAHPTPLHLASTRGVMLPAFRLASAHDALSDQVAELR
jgi:hypothetical protein